MQTLEDLNRRHESNMRARALVARAISKALDPGGVLTGGWVSHVERACGPAIAAELQQKAMIPAGTLGHAVWGGPLTSERVFSDALLGLVTPFTVPDRLQGVLRAPMNVLIPKQTTDEDPVLTWVAEGAPTPDAKLSFDQVALPPAKLARNYPFSRELVRQVDMQNIIERRVVRGVARGTDRNFLDPSLAAVPNSNPASITFGATEIPSTGATAAAVEADVADALGALSGGIPARPYVVVSPSVALYLSTLRTSGERVFPNIGLMGGDVLGVPALISLEADNYFVALDAEGIVIANGGISIDASEQAAIQQDDAPSGGPTNLISLWQNDAIALKVTRWISWARRDDAVSYIDFPFGSPGSPA
jgi:hypothetical protein